MNRAAFTEVSSGFTARNARLFGLCTRSGRETQPLRESKLELDVRRGMRGLSSL
jgi:hypothetical protein